MSATRLLFDENTGAPFVEALRKVVNLDRRRTVELAHTIEMFGRGAKDADWIPRLQSDAWIVISEDRGVNSGRGDKLPVLCLQNRVTHVLVLPALLRAGGQFEKMRALLAVWPQLIALPSAALGTRFKLKYTSGARLGFRLEAAGATVVPTPTNDAAGPASAAPPAI